MRIFDGFGAMRALASVCAASLNHHRKSSRHRRTHSEAMNHTSPRYDLLACNLALATISAVLMAAVGSSVKVVQVLDGVNIAGFDVDLGLGASVNPGVLMASVAVLFSMTAALCARSTTGLLTAPSAEAW